MRKDVVIIGAGAAGLMCAAQAGYRGRNVLLLDHAKQVGKKILISGGGRCNFTNMYVEPSNYLSHNPHFCKSALAQYTNWDFIGLVAQYGIAYHEKNPEKELGQLFCDDTAKDIVSMLVSECEKANVDIQLRTHILSIEQTESGFNIKTSDSTIEATSLVIATGGLSMPKLGATPFGFQIAEQFGLDIYPTRAGLVPFTLHEQDKQQLAELSGVSMPSIASNEEKRKDHISFKEDMLITHRGLSGPSVLQISNYWTPGETVTFNLSPELDIEDVINEAKQQSPEQQVNTLLSRYLPKRLVPILLGNDKQGKAWSERTLKSLNPPDITTIANAIHQWQVKPNGTEGYRTAEVTIGGVNTDHFSSKTMECKTVPGLFMVGEVLDVTGWLGGYNFQWAWSSGWVAGQHC
jgi:predicted Rossmann fold flavoprotein